MFNALLVAFRLCSTTMASNHDREATTHASRQVIGRAIGQPSRLTVARASKQAITQATNQARRGAGH
ncbi:hypothetical protein N9L68_05430 [bacterium]|nr:hypothetical protein [bacterium]